MTGLVSLRHISDAYPIFTVGALTTLGRYGLRSLADGCQTVKADRGYTACAPGIDQDNNSISPHHFLCSP